MQTVIRSPCARNTAEKRGKGWQKQELQPKKKLFYRCQLVGERYLKWRRVMQKERNLKRKIRLEKITQGPSPK